MLDPRRLLTFRQAARSGSFTRAAVELSLTQSAVSQQVGGLERQLGVRLLRRGRRGLTLTADGELLLAHADAVATTLELAAAQLEDRARTRRRQFRVGAFPSALADLVPAAVAAVRAAEPGAWVEAIEASTADLHGLVRTGRLHLAVCFGDRADTPAADLDRHDLFVEPLLVALSPDHALAARRTIPLTALADEDWLTPGPDHLVVRACRGAGFEPTIAFQSTDPLAIRALCAAGLAVTLVPRLLADHLTGVAVRPVAPHPPDRLVYAVTPRRADPLARVALDGLRAAGAPW